MQSHYLFNIVANLDIEILRFIKRKCTLFINLWQVSNKVHDYAIQLPFWNLHLLQHLPPYLGHPKI